MALIDYFRNFLDSKPPLVEKSAGRDYGIRRNLFSMSFDGEKTPGELGDLIHYHLDYSGLRLRSWESYLSSKVSQTIVKRFSMWVIGSGLKLQSEPIKTILEDNKITINVSELSKKIENRFKVFSDSKDVDHSEIKNLHKLAKTALINSIVGGDILVVLRYDGNINIQLIDGNNIQTPRFSSFMEEAKQRGNTIKNGIEVDSRGRHIAFYVKEDLMKYKRILAKGIDSGMTMAYLVCGLEYRLSDNRGIPLFSAVLETLKKLDRYEEATVGSAEERAKVPFFVEHGISSTGENPVAKNLGKSFDYDNYDNELAHNVDGETLANNIAVTMGKQVYNLPQDSTLKSLDSKSEIHFSEFYSPIVNAICASVGIPPEVALSKYDSNFSASRAALKDWEHTLEVERKDFSDQFYKPIYNFFLDIEILKNNIQAPGYLKALQDSDKYILSSYRNCRFIGSNVPHIDPVKEVQAERLKLGGSGSDIPLTTAESSTEALNGGDYSVNFKKYSEELKEAEKLEIIKKENQNKNNNAE